jgi:hypothetical protein
MKRGLFLRVALIGAAVTFGGSMLAPSARADAVDFLIGPYVDVNVNLTSSTTAKITFTSLTNSGNIYLMGADVNVNATSWTIGSFTASNSGTGFSTVNSDLSDGHSGNVSAFGVFNQTVNSFDGFSHSSDTISFVLTNTSGNWANAGSVLVANSDGRVAAAHIFVTSSPAIQSNGASVTGFAATPGPIPGEGLPGVVAAACLGLVGLARRRQRQRNA